MRLKNGEQAIETLLELRHLGGVTSATSEGRLEEEFGEDVGDGSRVGLVDRKPLLNDGTLLEIRWVEGLALVLVGQITRNRSRLEQSEGAVIQGGDLTEGLVLSQVGRSFVFSLEKIDLFEFVVSTEFFKNGNDRANASGAIMADDFVRRHG